MAQLELDEQEKKLMLEFEEYVSAISASLASAYANKIRDIELEKIKSLEAWNKEFIKTNEAFRQTLIVKSEEIVRGLVEVNASSVKNFTEKLDTGLLELKNTILISQVKYQRRILIRIIYILCSFVMIEGFLFWFLLKWHF